MIQTLKKLMNCSFMILKDTQVFIKSLSTHIQGWCYLHTCLPLSPIDGEFCGGRSQFPVVVVIIIIIFPGSDSEADK